MTVLVTGGDGQLGRALAALDRPERRVLAMARGRLDITDPDAVRAAVAAARPAVVINAAAMTDVDAAEGDRDRAFAVNETGAAVVADACRHAGARLVQVSTNYVFDGAAPAPYGPDAAAAPHNVYGASKLAGEAAARAAYPDGAVVLRTSWVFSPTGRNFVRSIAAAAATRDRLDVVDDQSGRPTAAADLAVACLAVADAPAAGGIVHVGGDPPVTWYDFAVAIVDRLADRLDRRPAVVPVATAQVPRPARRPANGVLDCRSYVAATGRALPDWRPALDRVLAALSQETGGPERR